MKDQEICVKCKYNKVKKIKALPVQIQKGLIPKLLNPIYYVCTSCGYMETWVENKEELEYIEKNN